MGTKLRIITIAVTGSLLFLPTVDTFSVIPTAQKQRVILTKKNVLWGTTTALEAPVPKKEKTTKEAQELLDVLEARENGATKLLVAQVAPSVRYICLLCLCEQHVQESNGF
jgi:hypothetical protein